jgi:predicted DNA-binding transcriptional regulator AlpA
VLDYTGFSRSTLLEKIAKGQFPAPFKLSDSGRSVAWDSEEIIREWADRLKRAPEPDPQNHPIKRTQK